MPEMTTPMPPPAETPARFDAASLHRLRGLSRTGFSPKTMIKSVTPFEIAALVVFVLLVVGTFVVYSFWILPDQVRYVQMSNQVSSNRAKLEELQKTIVDPNSLTSHFQEVRDSLDQFRGATLKPRLSGRRELLDAIDRSTRETGVRLASAVAFETRSAESRTESAARGQNKVRNNERDSTVRSYPSLQMAFSVTGSYEQLRAFIARFESSGQFVVIDAITLNTDDNEESEGPNPRGGRGGVAGPVGAITLDISMTAYFQPEQVGMLPVEAGQ